MEQQKPLLRGTAFLSEDEKLQLFAIEELETRLEMAGNLQGTAVGGTTPGAKAGEEEGPVNGSCWMSGC